MGSRMARNLVAGGHRVLGFDIRDEAVTEFAARGGIAAQSAAQVVQETDVVLLSLVKPVLLQVAEQFLLPGAQRDQVFIDTSTLPVPDARALCRKFEAQGAHYLDVPVSGWITGAESGTLTMFVGGNENVAREHWDIFRILGHQDRAHYAGSSGMGQAMKVVQQLKNRLLDAARLEILAFARRSGLDWEKTAQALGVQDQSQDPFRQLMAKVQTEPNELGCLFSEWPYYLEAAAEAGIPMPILESLYRFCRDGKLVSRDEQGRECPSVWNELIGQPGPVFK